MNTNTGIEDQNTAVKRQFHDRHHVYEFLLGCEIGRMYLENPDMILKVKKYLDDLRTSGSHKRVLDTWDKIIDLPINEIAAKLSQNDEEGDWIRQSAPKVHVIPIERRRVLMAQARKILNDQAA